MAGVFRPAPEPIQSENKPVLAKTDNSVAEISNFVLFLAPSACKSATFGADPRNFQIRHPQ